MSELSFRVWVADGSEQVCNVRHNVVFWILYRGGGDPVILLCGMLGLSDRLVSYILTTSFLPL